MNSLVSIVLPVYNGEKYIQECVDSIVNQTYENWELIIINDGSTDKTDIICKDIAQKENRIKYYRINNGGVSNARNYALSKAIGEFIFFIDADDYIKKDCLDILIKEQKKINADITVCGYYVLLEDSGETKKNDKVTEYEVLQGKDIVDSFLLTDKFGWEIWGKLIKRDLLQGITFLTNRKIAEDAVFLYTILLKCEIVVLLPVHEYFYRINQQSVMAQKLSDKNFDTILSVNDIFQSAKNNGYESAKFFKIKYYIWFLRQYIKKSTKQDKVRYKNRIAEIKAEIKTNNNSEIKKGLTKKYFCEFLMIKYVYGLYTIIIKVCY